MENTILETLLASSFGLEIGLFINPLLKKLMNRNSQDDVLIHGVNQPKHIPILDKQLQKHLGVDLNWLQRKSHEKFLKAIRGLVNTKAFEIVTAKAVKSKWPMKTGIDKELV
jgi:hypothetical protein